MQHLREGLPAPVHLDDPGEGARRGTSVPLPEDFYIDMDVCMNCGLCSEYCPFDAIKMDQNFELSNYERHQTHIYSLQDLLVSSEYYAKTHPEAWAQRRGGRRADKVAKKKDQRLQKALGATAAKPAAAAEGRAGPRAAGHGRAVLRCRSPATLRRRPDRPLARADARGDRRGSAGRPARSAASWPTPRPAN